MQNSSSDCVICEYAGRVCDGRGLHNDWSHRLASGNHRVVLRHLEGGQYLYKPTGGCGELMEGISRVSDAVFLHARETTWSVDEVMDEDALARDYGIRIVDFSIRHER